MSVPLVSYAQLHGIAMPPEIDYQAHDNKEAMR